MPQCYQAVRGSAAQAAAFHMFIFTLLQVTLYTSSQQADPAVARAKAQLSLLPNPGCSRMETEGWFAAELASAEG